jgi:hypothetical protein
MSDLLKNVPPWAQRLVTIVVGAIIAVIGVKVAGLDVLKTAGLGLIVGSVGVGIASTAVPHPADAQRFAPADPPPPNPPAP